jgi:hypothetical protein
MTTRQTLQQTLFTMSTIYGILINPDLKEALQEDTQKLMDLDLFGDRVEIYGKLKHHTTLLKELIEFDKFVDDLENYKRRCELLKACHDGKSNALAIARKASRLLVVMNKKCPRLIYRLQLCAFQFVFDKHDQFI